jgi:hypothetical protein
MEYTPSGEMDGWIITHLECMLACLFASFYQHSKTGKSGLKVMPLEWSIIEWWSLNYVKQSNVFIITKRLFGQNLYQAFSFFGK